jgi:exopolysaccharide production protein ExoY
MASIRSGAAALPMPHLGFNLTPIWALALGLGIDLSNSVAEAAERLRLAYISRHARFSSSVGGIPKRALDIAVAVTALALLAPVMALVAAAIALTIGRPVIFAHTRVGLGGETFRCFKFRSMVLNGDEVLKRHLAANPAAAREWNETRKLRDDPRVTPLGRILRKTSLDELPQLFNVLRGEMSCVGPRPIVAAELERYGSRAGHYLRVRPGLTGLWQVSGRSQLGYRERVKLDCVYVRRWSLGLDIALLFWTIPAVLAFHETA